MQKKHGSFNLALDIGCGTGQVTIELAKKFDQVYGIDTLEEKIQHAGTRDNIVYQVGQAEDLSQFKDHTIDMVTVGTAFHWFYHDTFFKETKRVLKHYGTLAVFGYFCPVIQNGPKEANEIVKALTIGKFEKYSNTNVRLMMNMYRDIKFPFEKQIWYITSREDTTRESSTQDALMQVSMTIEKFGYYLKTSSSLIISMILKIKERVILWMKLYPN